jgi:hypothetical protein
LTSTEIAVLAGAQFGAETQAQAAALGAAADGVVYSAATVISPDEADTAWSRERALRQEVRRQLRPRGRLAASLRYSRPKPATRPTGPDSWALAAATRKEALAAPTAPRRARRRNRRAH